MKLKILLLATSFALSHNASSREVEAKIYCGNDEGTNWGWLHTDEYNPSNENIVTIRGDFKFFQTMTNGTWQGP